ncbi:SRPBCC family protein [Microbacterium sp. C7(2022)]|uniref:SRPBCC family protein n=1 Tax=Microbacterium sp. C7(2022) TaxID=2992759 RepID=UPI00237B3111|nr:SRPBCC family protein [Microbacterium sp. C7(2022)]MDE0546259.1 SRPBCC family protein [Microbacterium sp. C7(2022)]
MPITHVDKDATALTMTVVAEFAASVERLWNAYTDPRQIEKFWGPPSWPATFYRHDVYPGGRSQYTMTGPDGERSSGFWEFLAVDPGRSFEVRDGFANEAGEENTDMPSMRMTFVFDSTDAGSRLTTTTYFPSAEALEELIGMGMEDGMREAMSQIDAVLADLASFSAELATEAQILDDTHVRVARVIRGSVEDVWRAHHDADLMKRWLLGPDGWEMTVCDLAASVGDDYRHEWAPVAGGPADGADAFGFVGELLESDAPHREVTTENMIGLEGPGTVNEMTLTPVDGGTLLSIVVTYPSAEVRDIVLATGMTDGMETSYARLESELAHA